MLHQAVPPLRAYHDAHLSLIFSGPPYIRPPTSYYTKLAPAEKLHLLNIAKLSLIVIFTTPQLDHVAIRKSSIPSRPSDVTIPF